VSYLSGSKPSHLLTDTVRATILAASISSPHGTNATNCKNGFPPSSPPQRPCQGLPTFSLSVWFKSPASARSQAGVGFSSSKEQLP
jgi:hypothetical protein